MNPIKPPMKSGNRGPESEDGQATFVVRGTVQLADGSPAAGVTVMAFDQDLRSEEKLGEALTNELGNYEITYTADLFRRAEKETADLVVRAQGVNETAPAGSPTRFNAQPVETVNLVFGGGPFRELSEYERLRGEVVPVLDGADLSNLSDEDLDFLAAETRQDRGRIAFLAVAARLTTATGIEPEAFYGWFRQNLPTELAALFAQSTQSLLSALKASIAANIIPLRLAARIDAILDRMHQLAVEHAFRPPDAEGRTGLGALVATALDSRRQQETFVSLLLKHQGPLDTFWEKLGAHSDFSGPGIMENLRFTFDAGDLSGNHLPMVRALQTLRASGTAPAMRDLARFDPEQWLQLIEGSGANPTPVGTPPNAPGATDAERAQNYANSILARLDLAFPTVAIERKLRRDDLPGKADLMQFFRNAPEFDLGTIPVSRFLSSTGATVFNNVGDPAALTRGLEAMDRVFRVSPRYEHLAALLKDGLTSATDIASMDRDAFVASYAAKWDRRTAEMIQETASERAAMSLVLLTTHGPMADSVTLAVTPTRPADVPELPEWKTLFGGLELCACEHCRSVLSPAAYLVDILGYLGKAKFEDKRQPILFKRRPDIQEIELSCENTNTPLPYVDLVNEILEHAVVPVPAGDFAEFWQTRLSAAELSAAPEHVNTAAYTKLSEQVYPPDLPFDRVFEERRLCLEGLGTPLHAIWKTLQTLPRPKKPASPSDAEIAADYLGMTAVGMEIITGKPRWKAREFWGYQPTDKADFVKELSAVPLFLERSRLGFSELLELLALRFVNPSRAMRVVPETSCHLNEMTIAALDELALDRAHRFLRLWRKLGWTMRELDQAIATLQPKIPAPGPGGTARFPDNAFLVKLRDIQTLRTRFKIPIVEVLTWWGPMDTASYVVRGAATLPSLYDQVFRPKTEPVDPGLDLSALGKQKLRDHLPAVQAALGLSADDLGLLTHPSVAARRVGTPAQVDGASVVTLESLTTLYRLVSLARALRLPLEDFLSILAITGIDPFAGTVETIRFVEAVDRVRASQFSVEQLNWLFRHFRLSDGGAGLTPEAIEAFITGLQQQFTTMAAEVRPTEEPTRASLQTNLGFPLPPEAVVAAIRLILRPPIDPKQKPPIDRKKDIERWHAFLDKYAEAVSRAMNPGEAKATLERAVAAGEREVWVQYFVSKIMDFAGRCRVVQAKVAETVGLTDATAGVLLDTLAAEKRAFDVFFADSAAARQALTRVDKLGTLIRGFGIRDPEFAWVYREGPKRGWLDFAKVALTDEDGSLAPGLFSGWSRLSDVFGLLQRVPALRGVSTADPAPLFEVFSLADSHRAKAATRLKELTGWDSKALASLGYTLPAALQDERSLLRLEPINALPPIDYVAAGAAKQALRARYDNAAWLKVLKPISDRLRDKQRAALVSYLTWNLGFKSPDRLYGHFLIDVEMSPCQLTSRIKQAISSVQLFIQGAYLGLEPGVTFTETEARLWQWMKNYRVWEANRKVFLWPENWIEPELRDDKTPFFKELEDELQQNELTSANAEKAFTSYLTKLNSVARLEVVGMYQEDDGTAKGDGTRNNDGTIHVFGRTFDTAPQYFYRRRQRTSRWTGWERVDLDIEGNHLIPVVEDCRLRLWWPIFKEKEKAVSTSLKVSSTKQMWWEIALAWSDYSDGQWSAKRVARAIDESYSYAATDGFSIAGGVPLTYFSFKCADGSGIRVNHRFSANNREFQSHGCSGELQIVDSTLELRRPWLLVVLNQMWEWIFIPSEASPKNPIKLPERLGTSFDIEDFPILQKLPESAAYFRAIPPHQEEQFTTARPFFVQDGHRCFLVTEIQSAKGEIR